MPTLTEATARAVGVTGWSGMVRTDEAGGTLHALASANETETADSVLASGRATDVTSPGAQVVLGAGLAPGATYRVHFVHQSDAGQSAVLSTPPFSTSSLDEGDGTLAISVLKRRFLQIAPDAVFFEAEAEAPGVSRAATRRDYDESFHKLLYVWDFGDPGAASDKVVNLPVQHNDLNRAYGRAVAHVFTMPGVYTVTCTAYDADGVLIGSARTEVEVGDPDTLFAGRQTILIDPDLQGDATRYPDALVVGSWDDAWSMLQQSAAPGRILLKRGTQTVVQNTLVLNPRYHNAHVSAWGSGPRPILRTEEPDLVYGHARGTRDIMFQSIDLRGPWDSVTETGLQPGGIVTEQENDRSVILDDCTLSGFGIALHLLDEREATFATMMAVHNCDVTNWGNYGAYYGRNVEQFIAFLGTAIHQHPEALMGGGDRKEFDTNQHGPIRLSNGGRTHVSACDLFSRNGWSTAAGIAADQPCFRWSSSSEEHFAVRSSCTIERTAMEGGFTILAVTNATGNAPYFGTNIVIDKCLLVGTARTKEGIGIQYTGTTVRNTIMVRPATPMISDRWRGWVHRIAGDPDQPVDPADPVEVYANTMVNAMDDAQREGHPLILENRLAEFETFSFENNVAFTPNAPDQQPEDPGLSRAPMTTAGGIWTSRYLGPRYRDIGGSGALMTLDARFATPANAVGNYIPQPGAPVVDDASGRVPVDDFYGRMRSETPERGAVEL